MREKFEKAQLQHHMAIKKFELNGLSCLKLQHCDTLLPNTTVSLLFIKIFGWEM